MSDSFVTTWTVAHQAPLSIGFPSQEYWNGLPFLLQGIFLTQGQNPSLVLWQVDSSLLSHQGSPVLYSSVHGIFQARVLEWGAISFSIMVYYRINLFIEIE